MHRRFSIAARLKCASGIIAACAMALASTHAAALDGQQVFESTCVYCHGPNGNGTKMLAKRLGEDKSLLVQRTDLQPAYIKAVVRNGIGSMPWYRYSELPDAQLEAVIDYLTHR